MRRKHQLQVPQDLINLAEVIQIILPISQIKNQPEGTRFDPIEIIQGKLLTPLKKTFAGMLPNAQTPLEFRQKGATLREIRRNSHRNAISKLQAQF